MWTRCAFAAAVAVAAGVTAAACTGDDPDLMPGSPDGGGGADATVDASGPPDTGGPDDAGDAGAKCHPEDKFGTATLLDGVNDGNYATHPALTPDEKEIFYQHVNSIYRAVRADRALGFDKGAEIPTSDAGLLAQDPAVSGNTLALYIAFNTRIARMSRGARTAPFGPPVFLELGDAGVRDADPHILADESALYFARQQPDGGPNDIWRAQGMGDGGFAAPVRIDLGGDSYTNPSVSEDELVLYVFHQTTSTMRRSIRAIDAGFPTPATVDEINAQAPPDGGGPRPGWTSPDGCRMYFAAGGADSKIYLAERAPR